MHLKEWLRIDGNTYRSLGEACGISRSYMCNLTTNLYDHGKPFPFEIALDVELHTNFQVDAGSLNPLIRRARQQLTLQQKEENYG